MAWQNHSPHASAVYSTPHGDDNSKHPVDCSGSNDITIVHTPPPKWESSTAVGRVEIMNFTKCKVLPNPNSESLTDCDDNSATHVLAATIYCQLEKNYFDKTHSRNDVAALFRCNTSQLSQAITGVDYKSEPSYYKPKKVTKRAAESSTQDPTKQKAPRTADADPKEAFYQRTLCQAQAATAVCLPVYSKPIRNLCFFFLQLPCRVASLFSLYKINRITVILA